MIIAEDKILVLFETKSISAYLLRKGTLERLSEEKAFFEQSSSIEILVEKIDTYLESLAARVGELNNTCVRLYATGIFQEFSQQEQDRLVISIYVNHGLYFNVVSPELEQFYIEKSVSSYGIQSVLHGLIEQEFRRVVICGSFQQHLDEIGEVMAVLQKRNISVLSPWTTRIVPETLGTYFILLEGQEPLKNKRDAWKHKYIHMSKFRQSDAIIVCNPDGLIGKGTMFEFGFMVAISKRIIFTEIPKDLSIPFPYEVGLNFN